MLELSIPHSELYDETNGEFITIGGSVLQLEHSLSAISKWEGRWRKPFLTEKEKNMAEILDYIRCMTLNIGVDPKVYNGITYADIRQVHQYIEEPMTATWFRENNRTTARCVITAEIIYYKMLVHNIPLECERWHLNRLLTLIRVCDEKNSPKKKMSSREIMERNRAINTARRNRLKSKG